jgi:glutaredoxin
MTKLRTPKAPRTERLTLRGHSPRWAGSLGTLLLAACLAATACKQPPSNATQTGSGPVSAPETRELPPLVLKDDTPDLLLTWIDKGGDFHVVQKPADVPEEGRAQVRTVVASLEAGTGDAVYVANLTAKNADGSYPVKTMSRSDWNNLGANLRKVRLEAMAPPTQVTPGTPPAGAAEDGSQAKADYSKVRVIIYGASWCKPCHDAEKFLRALGADVTKKDVEESRSAQAEMQQKLSQAGRMGSSIPVIDVAGTLLVGFSEDALRRALQAAARSETL